MVSVGQIVGVEFHQKTLRARLDEAYDILDANEEARLSEYLSQKKEI